MLENHQQTWKLEYGIDMFLGLLVGFQQLVSRAVFGSRVEARSICFEGVYCSVLEQLLGVKLSAARLIGFQGLDIMGSRNKQQVLNSVLEGLFQTRFDTRFLGGLGFDLQNVSRVFLLLQPQGTRLEGFFEGWFCPGRSCDKTNSKVLGFSRCQGYRHGLRKFKVSVEVETKKKRHQVLWKGCGTKYCSVFFGGRVLLNTTAIQNVEKENVSDKVEGKLFSYGCVICNVYIILGISYLLTCFFHSNDHENVGLALDCCKGVKKNPCKKSSKWRLPADKKVIFGQGSAVHDPRVENAVAANGGAEGMASDLLRESQRKRRKNQTIGDYCSFGMLFGCGRRQTERQSLGKGLAGHNPGVENMGPRNDGIEDFEVLGMSSETGWGKRKRCCVANEVDVHNEAPEDTESRNVGTEDCWMWMYRLSTLIWEIAVGHASIAKQSFGMASDLLRESQRKRRKNQTIGDYCSFGMLSGCGRRQTERQSLGKGLAGHNPGVENMGPRNDGIEGLKRKRGKNQVSGDFDCWMWMYSLSTLIWVIAVGHASIAKQSFGMPNAWKDIPEITTHSIMTPKGRTSNRKKKVPNWFKDMDCELMKGKDTDLRSDDDVRGIKIGKRGNNKGENCLKAKEIAISDVLENEGCLDRIRSEIDKGKECLDDSEFPALQESVGRKGMCNKEADDDLSDRGNIKVQSELNEQNAKVVSHTEITVSPTELVDVCTNEPAETRFCGQMMIKRTGREHCGKDERYMLGCFKLIGYPPNFGKRNGYTGTNSNQGAQNFNKRFIKNNSVGSNSLSSFSDEQISKLLSLIKDTSVNDDEKGKDSVIETCQDLDHTNFFDKVVYEDLDMPYDEKNINDKPSNDGNKHANSHSVSKNSFLDGSPTINPFEVVQEKQDVPQKAEIIDSEEVGMTEEVLVNPTFPEQLVTISKGFMKEYRRHLTELLRKNKDVFVWQPADMTGFPRRLIKHHLTVNILDLPVAQKKHNLSVEKNQEVSNEVEEWLKAGIKHSIVNINGSCRNTPSSN
ncbi:TO45-2 [Artemisia annua]|uniref:TO45-2 n=1 Tax=Artemisia annua TaxID=35608 RepID=A0A2U1QJG5_ARTAN|nr:TO45-2 [Artemisia annua]